MTTFALPDGRAIAVELLEKDVALARELPCFSANTLAVARTILEDAGVDMRPAIDLALACGAGLIGTALQIWGATRQGEHP